MSSLPKAVPSKKKSEKHQGVPYKLFGITEHQA